jgi:TrmH family RNA methyltransferase
MLYTSIDNKKIKDLKKLSTKKYRDKTQYFLVEGEHLVLEAYKNNILEKLILLDGTTLNIDVDTMYVSNNVLKYISSLDTPPNVLGLCKKKTDSNVYGDRIVVLDGIQDPGNLGTIIRSAVAFNVTTIILSKDSVDLYNPKVIRATQGMLFKVNIIVKDLEEVLTDLKDKSYKIFGTKVNGGKSLKTIEKISKFAIIMGNEGNGVRKNILDMCDEYLYIDMNSECESLNVGVATSIILYQLDK